MADPPDPRDLDAALVARLRARDEAAFEELVERHHAGLCRLARAFVRSEAVAEEVAQEAWMAVLAGIDAFEGRGSFRGWLFSIGANIARRRGAHEARSVPFSSVDEGPSEPAVDPALFRGDDDPWPGHWAAPVPAWADPERALEGSDARRLLEDAIGDLPPAQREVVLLRDLHGLDGPEVCALLGLTEANQRVLLHRARARLRARLDEHLGGRR